MTTTLRVAAEEGRDSGQRAWAGKSGPAATGAGGEDVLAASAVPGVSSGDGVWGGVVASLQYPIATTMKRTGL